MSFGSFSADCLKVSYDVRERVRETGLSLSRLVWHYLVIVGSFVYSARACVLARAAKNSSKIEFVCRVGRNSERTAAFAQETGIPASRDLAGVLRDFDIAALVLALLNELHLEFAQLAARAGKHVFIEKPIANTIEDTLKGAQLEQACGVGVVVVHCARLLIDNRMIGHAIEQGDLGHVTQTDANFSNDRGLRLTERDWRWYGARAPSGSLSQRDTLIRYAAVSGRRYRVHQCTSGTTLARRRGGGGSSVCDLPMACSAPSSPTGSNVQCRLKWASRKKDKLC